MEGYVESAASGLLASISLSRKLSGLKEVIFPENTIIGSQSNYVSNSSISKFQPMNANYGILQKLDYKHSKKDRKRLYAERSIKVMEELLVDLK